MSPSTSGTAQTRLLRLTFVLFVSYVCVAIPLPVLPVYVTGRLGLNNVWAGVSIGIAFLSTILTRGAAGAFTDRSGAKRATQRGLGFYAAATVFSWAAGMLTAVPTLSFAVIVAGRLLLGLGESLVGVGIISWGIGLVGPARSGKVLALVGAAIYGALAVGGPVGLFLSDRLGFAGAMATSAVLPLLGLLALAPMEGVAPPPPAARPSFLSVLRPIWRYGAIVCLQGIGFAAIGAFFVLHFLHEGWSYAGLGFTAFGGGFVLVRVLLGHLPDRVGGVPVALGSLAVEAFGQFLIYTTSSPLIALAGAFFTGLGCSLIFPSMGREVVQLVPPHLRGIALGGFSAFQDLAYGLTGPVAGFLADRAGYGSVFLIGSAAAITGLFLALSLRWNPPTLIVSAPTERAS